LCPNPIFTSAGGNTGGRSGSGGGGRAKAGIEGGGGRNRQQQQQQQPSSSSRLPIPTQALPNEIWAVKTHDQVSQLPCRLRQYAVPLPPINSKNGQNGLVMMNAVVGGGGGAGTRHNNGHYIENQLLFINVSLVPFNFRGATTCTKYIKVRWKIISSSILGKVSIVYHKSVMFN